jgi:hypothetical protein
MVASPPQVHDGYNRKDNNQQQEDYAGNNKDAQHNGRRHPFAEPKRV